MRKFIIFFIIVMSLCNCNFTEAGLLRNNFHEITTIKSKPYTSYKLMLLDNENVLIYGSDGSFLIYNLKTNKMKEDISLKYRRVGIKPVLLDSGRIFIPGNGYVVNDDYKPYDARYRKYLEAAEYSEIYSPNTNTSEITAKMLIFRTDFKSIKLQNGKILIVGGTDHAGKPVLISELYDEKTKSYSFAGKSSIKMSDIQKIKRDMGINSSLDYYPDINPILLDNGNVLVLWLGYCLAEIYNPETNTFSKVHFINDGQPEFRKNYAEVHKLKNGKIAIVGGFTGSDNVVLYDYKTNLFNNLGKIKLNHSQFNILSLAVGNNLLIYSGEYYGLLDYNSPAKDARDLILFNTENATSKYLGKNPKKYYLLDSQLLDNGKILFLAFDISDKNLSYKLLLYK